MGETTKRFPWKILNGDGIVEAVNVDVLAEDHQDLVERIEAATTPEQKREVRILVNFFAYFPGTTIVRPLTATGVPNPPTKRRPEPVFVTGRYHGAQPTLTEEESGVAVEIENVGPLKPGGPGHQLLLEFETGELMTSYEASFRATGNHHAIRREITRLVDRGFVRVDGGLPNPAPRGRGNVQAYRITERGRAELFRLRQPAAAR